MSTIDVAQPKAAQASEAKAAAPAIRRPGYPGCRHFNENYIGSWLAGSPLWSQASGPRH